MKVLIPMAGEGSRFAQEGYTFPKPLINVFGKPMVQSVVENLDFDCEYIAQLNEMYNQYYMRYNKSNLLVINTNNIDFVNNKDDFKGIMAFLNEPIKGRKYYNPIKSF